MGWIQNNKMKAVAHAAMFYSGWSFGGYNVLTDRIEDVQDDKFCRQTAFVLYRIDGAALLLALLVAIYDGGIKMPASWRHQLSYCVQGACGIWVNQYAFLLGLKYTSPTDAAVIQSMRPILILIFGWLTGLEKFTFRKLFGLLIAIGGGFIVIGPSLLHGTRSRSIGYIMLGMQLLLGAVYQLLVKHNTKRIEYSARVNTVHQFISGSILMSISAAVACHDKPSSFTTPGIDSSLTWITVAYAIIICSVGNYCLMTWAMVHLDASTVCIYGQVQPFSTAVIAFVAGVGEKVVLRQFGGVAVLALGIVLVSWEPSKPHSAQDINKESEPLLPEIGSGAINDAG